MVKDAEIRYIAESEKAVGKLTIAIDDGYWDKKTTNFIPVVCFGKTAENVEKFTKKGSKIAVTGRIKTGSYENKEGVKVYTMEVIADRIEFLDSKGDKAEGAQKPSGAIPEGFQALEDDDYIPF